MRAAFQNIILFCTIEIEVDDLMAEVSTTQVQPMARICNSRSRFETCAFPSTISKSCSNRIWTSSFESFLAGQLKPIIKSEAVDARQK